jgi:chemotaxis-related protein WspD
MTSADNQTGEPAVPAARRAGGVEAASVACWNESGVYGTGTCPKLQEITHCRHCVVYAEAARELLNRPVPSDYRREWSQHVAREQPPRQMRNGSVVLFRIDGDWLALPTQVFQEVAERRQIHSLPHRRQGLVLGLANVRGELLICVSLGKLLGFGDVQSAASSLAASHRLLVVNWETMRLAFPVAEVHGPHHFHGFEMNSSPSTVHRVSPDFTRALLDFRKQPVALLDAEKLLSTLSQSLM